MSQALSVSLTEWQPSAPPPEDDAEAIVAWAVERFQSQSVAMTTAFGMEGVALMHLLSGYLSDLRVIYVDTGFLFNETLDLREKLIDRFPQFQFEAAHPLLTPEEQAEQIGPALWQSNPDLCCRMRKVEPLHRAIVGLDVWFASIRRDQAPLRWNTKIVDWNWQYQLIKICPLATWTRKKTHDYVVTHHLPYNELHDRCFPSIGCTHCTKPVEGLRPWEYSRNGRWNGNDKTECGLHHGEGI
jgi:phosphoadenosine phosphosulfate reductase